MFFIKTFFVFARHLTPAFCVGSLVLMALFGNNVDPALYPPSDPVVLELASFLFIGLCGTYSAYNTIHDVISCPVQETSAVDPEKSSQLTPRASIAPGATPRAETPSKAIESKNTRSPTSRK